ncbi:MAG TPA: hypothetical protein VGF48_00855 [Thermoanaerobaculia bacterium]
MNVAITTEGGFTGRGIGSVTLDDPLPDEVARAVAAARPEEWQREYTVERGADLVRYTLTLGDVTTSWVTSAAIPPDLEALFDAAWRARSAAAPQRP